MTFNDYDQETYYNLEEFKESNRLFEKFLSKCKIEKIEKVEQSNFNISTMTIVTNICESINVKMVFQRLKVDNDIIYVESGNKVRGYKKIGKNKKKKKNIKDKRKLGKGCPFSNQISIGFSCNIKGHVHNNPICVKLFKNGRVQMTGCKDEDEIKTIYKKLYNKLNSINTNFISKEKIIKIYPFKKLKLYKDLDIKSEMINGTFSTNFKIDLNKMLNKISEIYSDQEIYINHEKKSPLTLYLKLFSIFDVKKQTNKMPSVFIYNSGSINIISINKEIILKSHKFISNFIEENFFDLVETNLTYSDEMIRKIK